MSNTHDQFNSKFNHGIKIDVLNMFSREVLFSFNDNLNDQLKEFLNNPPVKQIEELYNQIINKYRTCTTEKEFKELKKLYDKAKNIALEYSKNVHSNLEAYLEEIIAEKVPWFNPYTMDIGVTILSEKFNKKTNCINEMIANLNNLEPEKEENLGKEEKLEKEEELEEAQEKQIINLMEKAVQENDMNSLIEELLNIGGIEVNDTNKNTCMDNLIYELSELIANATGKSIENVLNDAFYNLEDE